MTLKVPVRLTRTSVVGARDPFPTSYDFTDMLAAARLLGDTASPLPNSSAESPGRSPRDRA